MAKIIHNSRTNVIIAVIVGLAVIVAGYFVLRTSASGYFAAVELEKGTVSGNAQIVDDSGASSGKAVKFLAGSTTTPPPTTPPPTTPPPTTPPPTTGTTTCPLPKYPNASCTGVPAGTSLSAHNGDFTTSSNGQVITGRRITGDLNIEHDNVVIRNSEIYGQVKNYKGTAGTFTIEDSTVGPPSGCVSHAALGNSEYTANRIYFRGFAEGGRVEDGGNVTIRHSFFKFCDPKVDNHGDALQGYRGGSNVIFEHNTIDMRAIPLEPKDSYPITASILWGDGSGNNVTYKDNLISGGGYTIRIYDGSGHTVTGNKVINNSYLYGPVDSRCSALNWSDNSLVEIDSNYNITKTVSSIACKG